jgi:hypothetical protein
MYAVTSTVAGEHNWTRGFVRQSEAEAYFDRTVAYNDRIHGAIRSDIAIDLSDARTGRTLDTHLFPARRLI